MCQSGGTQGNLVRGYGRYKDGGVGEPGRPTKLKTRFSILGEKNLTNGRKRGCESEEENRTVGLSQGSSGLDAFLRGLGFILQVPVSFYQAHSLITLISEYYL